MRIRQIDALRAVAVLLVLGCHMTWSPFLAWFGWTGVDLFFVLSGFLISGLLFQEYKHTGAIQVKRFMMRRALKIYPAYYVLLALTIGWYASAGTPIPWSRTWPDLIFVQNYTQGTWAHLWSLGVEEHFYILLPVCLYMLMSWKAIHKLPWIAGAVLIGCLVLRAAAWSSRLELVSLRFPMMPSQFRFDGLFFGVLLSYFREFHAETLERFVTGNRHILLAAGFVGLLPAAIFPQISAVVCVPGLSMLYLGYGSILLLCLYSKGEGRITRGLSRIGTYSYSIYLFHFPLMFICAGLLYEKWHWSKTAAFITYMVTSIIVGSVLSRAVELPILRLRERLFPGAVHNPALTKIDVRLGTARTLTALYPTVPADAPPPRPTSGTCEPVLTPILVIPPCPDGTSLSSFSHRDEEKPEHRAGLPM